MAVDTPTMPAPSTIASFVMFPAIRMLLLFALDLIQKPFPAFRDHAPSIENACQNAAAQMKNAIKP
jgi:hypothetical protein